MARVWTEKGDGTRKTSQSYFGVRKSGVCGNSHGNPINGKETPEISPFDSVSVINAKEVIPLVQGDTYEGKSSAAEARNEEGGVISEAFGLSAAGEEENREREVSTLA